MKRIWDKLRNTSIHGVKNENKMGTWLGTWGGTKSFSWKNLHVLACFTHIDSNHWMPIKYFPNCVQHPFLLGGILGGFQLMDFFGGEILPNFDVKYIVLTYTNNL